MGTELIADEAKGAYFVCWGASLVAMVGWD